jgi:uncharacterized cupredoxin-like copper-binding protein
MKLTMTMTMTMTIAIAATLLACTLPATAHEGAKHPRKVLAAEQKDWGIAGNTGAVTRTIEIQMTDNMRFTPERVEVRQGETVKLVVKNGGQMLHELVLGTKYELDAHAAAMMKFPGMEHDEAHMVHVKPAKAEPLVWNFNRAGEFQFACLIPGHYEAGMVGTIVVLPSSNQGNKS